MDVIQNAELVDAITLNCAVCSQSFSVCRSCWRGQKCCSKECSKELRKKRQRNYQKEYQATPSGLEFGRQRQRRRYEKLKSLLSPH